MSIAAYLDSLGVAELAPATSPFDPGYDSGTVRQHLAQSGHLMCGFKLSMACWQIAAPTETARKITAIRQAGIPVIAGGGPFEVAVAQRRLEGYLELCASLGFDRIEAGEGFTSLSMLPDQVVHEAAAHSLEVQFELGGKHEGPFSEERTRSLVAEGRRWLDVGARTLVIEARESARGVGLFDEEGRFAAGLAETFVDAFGFDAVVFEAPDKPSQFALLDHFGPQVQLSNVRLEEVLRVEIYRRGLHSDAFNKPRLALPAPRTALATS